MDALIKFNYTDLEVDPSLSSGDSTTSSPLASMTQAPTDISCLGASAMCI